ncbi:hypothetical protein [Streptomyces sp. NPDC059828]|uniref:hypothetical protein n=1 Tax=Streptomyces sp. NPDC059828 TaxID=3346965 RepID=UPI003657ECCB
MTDLVHGLLVAALVGMYIGTVQRQDRHIRYLRALAGPRDYWNTRCHHCRKRMRDANSIAEIRPGAVPGSTVHTVWHLSRSACAEAHQRAVQPRADKEPS